MRRREFLTSAAAVAAAACATPAKSGGGNAGTMKAAFLYAFPLYEFARTEQQRTGAGAGVAMNAVGHRAALADHTSRQVTTPNNDTIYSSAFLELSGGPAEVISPTETKRYFSIAFMDAFTDNFAYIGTRATKGQGGRFWIVGPTWKGTTPDGVKVLRSTTNDVWMLGRTLVDGPADMAAARAVQQQMKVAPATSAAARPYRTKVTQVEDPANFLAVVTEVLERSPGGLGQTSRAGRFASVLTPNPSPALIEAWRPVIPEMLADLKKGNAFGDEERGGWIYQARGVGNFGIDDRLRSRTALGGLAALGEEEAMYYQASADSTGQALSGRNAYRWRVPAAGIPTDAFWSLTMYTAEPDGRFFLADNPIHRYAIGDRTPGLVKNSDGSLDILIQRDAPTGPLSANWLPSPPGPMRLSLRAYLPGKALRDRTWKAPPLQRV